jgi:Trypsin-like peptidase domain
MRVTRRHRTGVALRAILATAVVALGTSAAPTVTEAFAPAPGHAGVDTVAELTGPHVLDGDVAEMLVRVDGDSVCSGTPIDGGRLVITAAHCILDSAGNVTAVTVTRDGVQYSPRAVLVNPRYPETPSAHLDAAVLVMDRAIPGPAATLGDTLPTQGLVTLAGFQPIDTDGTLLRGTSAYDRPTPKGVTESVVEIKSLPSGCDDSVSSIEIAGNRLEVDCGLVRGASGGGLFMEHGGRIVLLGIISTVDVDLSFNGLAPLAAVHDLLNHPRQYTHASAVDRASAPPPPTIRK